MFFWKVICLVLKGLKICYCYFQMSSRQQSCIPYEIRGVSIDSGCTEHDENFISQQLANNQVFGGVCPWKRKNGEMGVR